MVSLAKHSDRVLTQALRQIVERGFGLEGLQLTLAERNPGLPKAFLDPRLVPISLLVSPQSWRPRDSGIDEQALLEAHPELATAHAFVSSGRLVKVIQGEESLYSNLPPIHLSAYLDGLRPGAKKELQRQNISALEHLATLGWKRFREGRALGKDLDRYQMEPDEAVQTAIPTQNPLPMVLVVLGTEAHSDSNAATQIGWTHTIHGQLNDLCSVWKALPSSNEALVSFCHRDDRLASHASMLLAHAAETSANAELFSSDETLRWSSDPTQPPGNRQNLVSVQPWRLLTRGCIGGLVTIRLSRLRQLKLPKQRLCLHSLVLDFSLQVIAQNQKCQHLTQALLSRNITTNPAIPDVASPRDRQVFSAEQCEELLRICRERGAHFLMPGGDISTHPRWAGCHQVHWSPPSNTFVSILIPFRDGASLTKVCVESIRRCAGDIPYEIILIDNGSTSPETLAWLNEIGMQSDVTVLRIDCDFNYAHIHNFARPYCQGTHLLLLNNDIEARSENILQKLLDPFAVRHTVAVGARLRYPNNSIQHHGVVLIKGERRCVLEPGKHLSELSTIDMFTPLGVQEEWIAATAACLMLRTADFDQIGGFDEQLAVVFNDVDLCLRLRQLEGSVVVTPFVDIIHHESVSRGKDQSGDALARHQRESGYLRHKHAGLFETGDPLFSHNLHPHSNRFQPKDPAPHSSGRVSPQQISHWRQRNWKSDNNRPLIVMAHFDPSNRLRPDLLKLLESYAQFGDVVLVSASPGLRWHWNTMRKLKRCCRAILIRRNEGYDFGSWMAALRWLKKDLHLINQLILTNDSFWGPITPLDDLFQRLKTSSSDVIGLTDDQMYTPHLQSAFLAFQKPVIQSDAFQSFWDQLELWPRKRDLIKKYEVGLPVRLQKAGFKTESLYTQHANGNILHTAWRELIEARNFPFLKVSLLRDNPMKQDIDDWEQVISERNPILAAQIRSQLKQTKS
jgi:O-antigen biosynthesis protein